MIRDDKTLPSARDGSHNTRDGAVLMLSRSGRFYPGSLMDDPVLIPSPRDGSVLIPRTAFNPSRVVRDGSIIIPNHGTAQSHPVLIPNTRDGSVLIPTSKKPRFSLDFGRFSSLAQDPPSSVPSPPEILGPPWPPRPPPKKKQYTVMIPSFVDVIGAIVNVFDFNLEICF